MRGKNASCSVDVVVSDPAELRSLREHLGRIPGVEVTQVPGRPGAGEQGAWDLLQVLAAGGGVLAVTIKTLPEFIRSRRSNVTVTLESGDRRVTVTAENVEDAEAVVDKLLGDA
ncbi:MULTISPECIES: effector-associated constant component EACC1 [Amycolatopsis]|uniref:Uncharacterized protein n=1 Tax=Amycolatopsis thermalba TaxID=944492 RepID=A0ABY4NRN1_9PSEU|nr:MULTISPECIES: hypothetical protein [Amycolatopsis]OXM68323.1 hypothetical protein CF166_23060 [Amycolatopsis sp. KNN50.9b]UQS22698.1 hypothetical protein L1857_07635 [Amycolatopsis thermalba]